MSTPATNDAKTTALAAPMPKPNSCGGRPLKDLEKHKDLIISLYHKKTKWKTIEDILRTEHGTQAKAQTIMRRFKQWDQQFHRVATDYNSDSALRDRLREYWADKNRRPKTDQELLQWLSADGISVSLSGIRAVRKELNLFRRWDEKLGRRRPDEELNRARRPQKPFDQVKIPTPRKFGQGSKKTATANSAGSGSASTRNSEAVPHDHHLAFNGNDDYGVSFDDSLGGLDHSSSTASPSVHPQQSLGIAPLSQDSQPPVSSTQKQGPGRPHKHPRTDPSAPPKNRDQPLSKERGQSARKRPAKAASQSGAGVEDKPDPLTVLYAKKNIQVRELQERVRLLEQHCLAHNIGLPCEPPAQIHSPAVAGPSQQPKATQIRFEVRSPESGRDEESASNGRGSVVSISSDDTSEYEVDSEHDSPPQQSNAPVHMQPSTVHSLTTLATATDMDIDTDQW